MVSIRLILILVGQVYLVQAGTVKFGNACSVTSDCEDNKSLECLFPYVNCDKGICVCPKGHTYETDGCKATQADLFVGDDCTALDSSRIKAWNAECSGTKVTCKSSSTKVDNSFCRGTTDKLRGEECPNIFDMCYKYKDGVAASPIGIMCMDVGGTKKCVCDLGYIDDGTTSCREKTVGDDCTGDSDCLKQNQECSSGSNKQCQCKSDTELSSGECQVKGTVTQGNVCLYSPKDALVATGFTCSIGLVCGTCPETTDNITKCLKPNSGSAVTPTLFHLVTAICMALFGRQTM